MSNLRRSSGEIIQNDLPLKPVTHPRYRETSDGIERRPAVRFLRIQSTPDTRLAFVRAGFRPSLMLQQKPPTKDFVHVDNSQQKRNSEGNLQMGWGLKYSESLTASNSPVRFSTPGLIIKKKKPWPEMWKVKQNLTIKGTKSFLCAPPNSTTLNTKRALNKKYSCPMLKSSPTQRLLLNQHS